MIRGGKSIYGASVGILMLEARFPRILGDMGNAGTWDFPVHYKVVRDASPDRVVRHGAQGLLDAFRTAAQELEADGVDGITTNCGFLSIFQDELSTAVSIPVLTSSLMQLRTVDALLPSSRRAGILTVSRSSLTEMHLSAAGVPEGTPIGTTEGRTHFTEAVLGNSLVLDPVAAEADNVAAAEDLVAEHPDIGAIVLECTNMAPYAAAIRSATGIPVFSHLSFVNWFQSSLSPRDWPRKT
ncbi:MAG: aspartate/glutamate racemase family protein [Boseongicola sp. SB0673_bin_14]|nr:aspartate/glutamate racemase family protein [Boseongicola sp. SB0673_bin_14]